MKDESKCNNFILAFFLALLLPPDEHTQSIQSAFISIDMYVKCTRKSIHCAKVAREPDVVDFHVNEFVTWMCKLRWNDKVRVSIHPKMSFYVIFAKWHAHILS